MPGAQEGEIMGHHGDFNDFDGDMGYDRCDGRGLYILYATHEES
jgi:hypothetical protein